MFKNILVALDGSERSKRSLPWVRLLAQNQPVSLVRVVPMFYNPEIYPTTLFTDLEQQAQEHLTQIAKELPTPPKTFVMAGSPAAAILDLATESGADLIVITTHGGSPAVRRTVGGTTEQLLHGSEIPLLVVPSWADKPRVPNLVKMVVPLDGSEASESILPLAKRIGQRYGATTVLTHVVTGPEEALRKYAELEGHFAKVAEQLDKQWVPVKLAIKGGKADEEILAIADAEQADLIVMAAHGYGAVKRMLFGSVASRIIRGSAIPVLVAKYNALKKRYPQEATLAKVR